MTNVAYGIFLVVYLVSPGYNITFNATEYEFDVDVHSPIGTVVFGALLIEENMIERVVVVGNADSYDPFSYNFISNEMSRNHLLTFTVNEALDPNDDTTHYNFNIEYEAFAPPTEGSAIVYTGSANVILHEIGKL